MTVIETEKLYEVPVGREKHVQQFFTCICIYMHVYIHIHMCMYIVCICVCIRTVKTIYTEFKNLKSFDLL